MNLLVVSFFPAFVPPKSGGEVRLYNLYVALSAYHNITLISSGHVKAEREEILHTPTFLEIRVGKGPGFEESWAELATFAGEGDLSAPALLHSTRQPDELHRIFLFEYAKADIIIHESPFSVNIDFLLGIDSKPRVYCSYNCETTLYEKLHPKTSSSRIVQLVRLAEQRLLEFSDLVTYCSDSDVEQFSALVGSVLENTILVPNGMSKRITTLRRVQKGRPRAVFVGSAHLPNVLAARLIVDKIAPLLPGIDFDIIGNCLPEAEYSFRS